MTHLQALLTLAITWAVSVVWDIIARWIQNGTTHRTATGWILRFVVPLLAVILIAGVIDAQTNNATLTVTWTAPGDLKPNGARVQCSRYEIRLDTLPIDTLNCTAANLWPDSLTPTPRLPDSAETFTFTGLLSERTYYVEIRAQDAAQNWALCSNIARKSTPDVWLPDQIKNLIFK
jgi:hypothetical protein